MDTTWSSSATRALAWVAIATGVIAVIGLICLIAFFTIGQPFGTLNDICIGLAGLLSAALAGWLFWVGWAGRPW